MMRTRTVPTFIVLSSVVDFQFVSAGKGNAIAPPYSITFATGLVHVLRRIPLNDTSTQGYPEPVFFGIPFTDTSRHTKVPPGPRKSALAIFCRNFPSTSMYKRLGSRNFLQITSSSFPMIH